MQRRTLLSASFLGLFGVVLGAFGAHALKARLLALGLDHAWETGVHFELFHAACLLALAALFPSAPERARVALRRAALGWTIGTLLFSGSLYALGLGASTWVGVVTPAGGICLIAGWLSLATAAFAFSE